jgi:leucyl/phenylalanyl-tRNA---protein transferase
MTLTVLDDSYWFPPVELALPDGLLAIGGDLATERLLLAYRSGIFPWFSDDEPPLWWSPDPRFVLFPDELKVSKSMKTLINGKRFEFRMNTCFNDVVNNCRAMIRKDQDGTWITHDIVTAYTRLHDAGYAFSAEAWMDGALVGGLYGVLIGKVFFGESMFSKVSNASKFAFIQWVRFLQQKGIQIIDCQVHTEHLESLGARMIGRAQFMEQIARLTE